jgi:hypothetical protein
MFTINHEAVLTVCHREHRHCLTCAYSNYIKCSLRNTKLKSVYKPIFSFFRFWKCMSLIKSYSSNCNLILVLAQKSKISKRAAMENRVTILHCKMLRKALTGFNYRKPACIQYLCWCNLVIRVHFFKSR